MQRFYRVTEIVNSPLDYKPDKSLMAMKKGEVLHQQIAQQYIGEGKYVETPLTCYLVNSKGEIITTLIGNTDLFWF